jgi:small-conductance mechanosensitive channel
MSEFWQRAIVAAAMIVAAVLIARFVDRRIARLNLSPEAATRYRVLRHSAVVVIVFVGVLSALLVIPQVRAIAGGILASSAILGLILGLAGQRTIGNAVAGVLIAVTQPLRLGDRVEVQGMRGIVEEIGLNYTWIRTSDNDRLAVPNERLVSDTIVNSTIRNPEARAEVSIDVPFQDLRRTVDALGGEEEEVLVTALAGDKATVVVRRWVKGGGTVERAESDLRVALVERLAAASP